MSIKDRVQSATGDGGWAIHTEGSLWHRGRVAVPQLTYLREEILKEFHCSRFVVHLGAKKMYHDTCCQLIMSTALHPQANGQLERTI